MSRKAFLDFPWPTDPSSRIICYSAGEAQPIPYPQVKPKRDFLYPDPVNEVMEQVNYAITILHDVIEIDSQKRGGVPVLSGTRMPISRLFSEVADGRCLTEIADDKELDVEQVRRVFKGFSAYLARSYVR